MLVATSEPDAHGYVSLGAALGMTPAVLASPCLAIAECVPGIPFTLGGGAVPLARFAATIQAGHAPASYSHPRNDDTGRRIGRYLSRLVEDGATLQTGPGAVANGALRYLAHKRSLRIHSDMVYDDVQVLIDAGALDANSAPAITTSHATGDPDFLRSLDRNPLYEFRRIEDIVDVGRLAALPKLVSITQAFAIDLSGRPVGQFRRRDSWRAREPAGVHARGRGQPGRQGGALPARARRGWRFRIGGVLRPGTVTLPRSDVHFVVTEFGIAYLQGKSLGAGAGADRGRAPGGAPNYWHRRAKAA